MHRLAHLGEIPGVNSGVLGVFKVLFFSLSLSLPLGSHISFREQGMLQFTVPV